MILVSDIPALLRTANEISEIVFLNFLAIFPSLVND